MKYLSKYYLFYCFGGNNNKRNKLLKFNDLNKPLRTLNNTKFQKKGFSS